MPFEAGMLQRNIQIRFFLVFSTSSLVVSIRFLSALLFVGTLILRYFVLLRNHLSSLFRINRT